MEKRRRDGEETEGWGDRLLTDLREGEINDDLEVIAKMRMRAYNLSEFEMPDKSSRWLRRGSVKP